MDRVRLGMTELEVSPICFGTWQLGGDWGAFDEEEAKRAIKTAHELGINFFDTAHGYGWGASERILGQALAGDLRRDRDSIVIATKGGLAQEGAAIKRDSSPELLREGVDKSLSALGLDHIDLFQLHWPDPATPFEVTAQALEKLVAEGKIRHVGVSNFDAAQMRELAETRPVETLQPPYHLFRREIEAEILPYCAEHDIGVLVYGPLAHGLLTGALHEDTEFAEDDWRRNSDVFEGDAYLRNLEIVRRLGNLAAEGDLVVSQLAIAWTLADPAVHASIVGTRNPNHIAEAVRAAEVGLTDDDLAAIERIMGDAVEVSGPSPEKVSRE